MSIKKILVTGSSGTIGTRLCEVLLSKGYEVYGVDLKPNKWNERVNRITLCADLREEVAYEQLPSELDLVIHLAANARVYNLVIEPILAHDNIETTFRVLEFVRKHHIGRVFFSSSREVYGNSSKAIHIEGDVRIEDCESPYTASKIAGEALAHAYYRCYKIDYMLFRFSNVYGMYDESDRVIPLFIRQCRAGEDLKIFGKEKCLDFTYIDDTIQGLIQGIEHFEEAKNNTYNLAYGEGISLVQLAETVREMTGTSVQIHLEENRIGEVVYYVADISSAQKKLGYQPQINFRRGLEQTIDWYARHEKQLDPLPQG